jgi:AcrR family transcriptional regulator
MTVVIKILTSQEKNNKLNIVQNTVQNGANEMDNELTREALIDLTVKLLNEGLDPDKITVRLIAQRAGVGVGLVNYHFQTKDNLINLAVQKHIVSVIARTPEVLKKITGSPKERLSGMFKATLDYLANYPEISRVSILRDMKSPKHNDNTQNTLKVYEPLVREVVGEKDARDKTMMLIFTGQSAFLRAQVVKDAGGFNFYDKVQRDDFVDKLTKILEENGFVVEATTIRDCGHFIQSNITVWWK